MKDRTDFTLTGTVSRRTLMIGATAGVAALAMPSVLRAQEKPTLVTSIRSLSNPYHAVWKTGAEAYAKWAGLEHVTLVSEGNSEKGIADIKAMLAKTGGNMVLNSDPNDTPDARPIVEACAKAGAYVVTQWNKPSDLHPKDFNPNYVSHIEFDGIESGKTIAEGVGLLIGGKGGIVALGERECTLQPAHARDPGRGAGRQSRHRCSTSRCADCASYRSLRPDGQSAHRFGDDIKGIWAANDDMGSGALEALRAENLAGKVPIVGVDGIKRCGDAVRTGDDAPVRHRPVRQRDRPGALPSLSAALADPTRSAGTPRILRQGGADLARQCRGLLQDQCRCQTGDRLERSVGPGDWSHPDLTAGRAAAPWRSAPLFSRREAVS